MNRNTIFTMPHRIILIFSDTVLKIVTVVLTLCVLSSLPMMFMILWPIYWLRIVTRAVGKVFIKDFVGILPTRNAVLFEERRNLVYVLFMDSSSTHLDLEFIRMVFASKILAAKNESGKIQYPELQQKIEKLFGFCYWKFDKNFSIENHIKYLEQEEKETSNAVGKDKLDEICKSLVHTPFKGDQSPWEILMMKNYSSEDIPKAAVLIFKFSNALLDLHSLVELLRSTGMSGSKEKNGISDNEVTDELPPKSKIKTALKMIFAIYSVIYNRIKEPSLFYDRNEWHPANSKIQKSFHLAKSINLSMKSIETISMNHRVPQQCVIFAGITGGMRQMMLKGNIKLPKKLRVVYPIILMDKKNKKLLKNHSTLGVIELPVGKADPVARILAIEEDLKKVEGQGIGILSQLYFKIVGGLFHRLTRRFGKIKFATMAFNSLSFPQGEFTLFDSKVIAMQALPVLQNGDFGVLGAIVSYKESWHLSLMLHWSLLSTAAEMDELNQLIVDEFHLLETYKVGSRHSRKQSAFSLVDTFNHNRSPSPAQTLSNI